MKRYIRLKEFTPGQNFTVIPSDDYIKNCNTTLVQKEYSIEVNLDGFYESLFGTTELNMILLIGDSFVENLYVDKLNRIVNNICYDGKILNAGYSGANTLHIINTIINKVIFNSSIESIIYIKPVSDISVLDMEGGFFNDTQRASNIIPQTLTNNKVKLVDESDHIVNYKNLFEICKNASKNLICFLTPYNQTYDSVYGISLDEYDQIVSKIKKTNHIFKTLAEENGVMCYDLEEVCSDPNNWYDIYHLNNLGSIECGKSISRRIQLDNCENFNSFKYGKFTTIHTFKGGIKKEMNFPFHDLHLEYNLPCWYRFVHQDICLDIYIHIKKADVLIVSGQDALISGRTDLPYFYRAKWSEQFDVSFITVNDPTLYDNRDLKAGWFQKDGALELWFYILDLIKNKLNTSEEKILFYGASAGGYFSIINQFRYPSASCIVDIPQTNLEDYPEQMHIELLKNTINNQKLKHVFDYFLCTVTGEFIYLQNSKDKGHIQTQQSFFFQKLYEYSRENNIVYQNMKIIYYKNEENSRGHSPFPTEKTIDMIKNIITTL